MPEDIINEVKEEQEESSDQVDSKTEQAFNLIRSHDEWMKKTQEFLDRNVNSLGRFEVSKKFCLIQLKGFESFFLSGMKVLNQ